MWRMKRVWREVMLPISENDAVKGRNADLMIPAFLNITELKITKKK